MSFIRPISKQVIERLKAPRQFIQVLAGPRQVGKTTLARHAMAAFKGVSHYATADDPALEDKTWIGLQWELARQKAKLGQPVLLVFDEIQKIQDWSTAVKYYWDQDTLHDEQIYVILLGSAPLLIQKGLSESLAGRFEIIPITHWCFEEMQAAFNFTLDEYIFFGAYPGAANLISDESRWRAYVRDALIETSISRDILLMTRVDKPALLRRLFQLSCDYSGQILSYQKMVGQLQDAGNTTTLAHYLQLLEGAGLVTGVAKFAGEMVRRRASSPKLQVLNTALMSTHSLKKLTEAKQDKSYWGRLVESAVAAHLLNSAMSCDVSVYYWRAGSREVDFVLERAGDVVAIEVKSGSHNATVPGFEAFQNQFKVRKCLKVGGGGFDLETFLKLSLNDLF